MDIITTPSMEEIIRQNKVQMRFLYKFSLKTNVDKNDGN